jgi:hypothetical protein
MKMYRCTGKGNIKLHSIKKEVVKGAVEQKHRRQYFIETTKTNLINYLEE